MLTIELNRLQFFGYHGVHEEESITGGNFEVEVKISFEPPNVPVIQLNETIDYTQVYEIIKERMSRRTGLIETLATEIAIDILNKFSMAEQVEISVKKMHPPIPFFNGSVAATYLAKRNKQIN